MTAPYPQYGPVVDGLYLTRQHNAGVPAGESVFAALANPQSTTINGEESSGPAAEAASLARAQEVGTLDPEGYGKLNGAKIAALASRNSDYLRDFYDSASILKDENGDPIS